MVIIQIGEGWLLYRLVKDGYYTDRFSVAFFNIDTLYLFVIFTG